jgi:glycosyltransferase involved in cell wall biosynthesis
MIHSKLLIVIPAYNEFKTISKIVQQCKKYGEVLVVNDGSKDKTGVIAADAGAHVITNSINLGYEAALNNGYAYAKKNKFEILITIDADGQFPVLKVPEFYNEIVNGAVLVVGRRQKLHRLTEILLSKFAKPIINIDDPYCGMKAYNLNECSNNSFSRYNSVGTSLMLSLVSLNLPISTIEVYTTRRAGTSKFGGRIESELKILPSCLIGLLRLMTIQLVMTLTKTKNKRTL